MVTFKDHKDQEFTMHFHVEREYVPANPNKEGSHSHMRPRHTTCLIKKDGKVIAKGIASCCATDNFTYKAGKKYALQRAIAKCKFNYETRKNAWNKMLGI